jgi:glycosyltransferase involved in cell wall biosynthesis
MNYDYDSIIKKSENAVIFLYAGSLYSDIRNPSYLVNLFEQLPQNYLLVIAGVNTELLKEYDEKIRDRVTYCGLVEQIEVEQMKRDADVLICFNNAIENQLPSKLFECIETGKPFINLCQLKNCPSLPYVEDYENTINVFVDDIKAEKIVDFIETHKNKVINRDEILKKYGKHTYEHVENQIEEVLTNVNI